MNRKININEFKLQEPQVRKFYLQFDSVRISDAVIPISTSFDDELYAETFHLLDCTVQVDINHKPRCEVNHRDTYCRVSEQDVTGVTIYIANIEEAKKNLAKGRLEEITGEKIN